MVTFKMSNKNIRQVSQWLLLMAFCATSIGGYDILECPDVCSCDDALTTINCAHASLQYVPKLPASAISVVLDNNELTQVHNKSFVGLSNLKVLSINNNKITTLNKDDFVGLSKLNTLRLAGNELEVLEEDVFLRIETITELDLSRNKFSLIPDHSIARLSSLRTLNLSSNVITSAEFGPGFTGTRALQVLDLSHNNFGVLLAHSFAPINHFTDRLSLNLSNCKIREIHEGIFRSAHVLHRLDLSMNAELPQEHLKVTLKELEITTINTLKLSSMNISDTYNLFHDLTLERLEHLDLSHNIIRNVRKRSFFKLRRLESLDLSHNAMASVGDYSGVGELKHLRLSNNKIREIDVTSIEICEQLVSLQLDHNELEYIEDAPFENMYELQELDISYNRITSFQISSAFEHLRMLSIASNRLTSLGAITRLRLVEELDISGNQLSRLDKELFVSGRVLTKVNFSGNSIREIEMDSFKSHTPTVIDLSHNRLTNVDNLGWTFVRQLHLQGNYIQAVSSYSFTGLKWLKYLDLSNNTVSSIDAAGFQDLHQLEVLDFSRNDLGAALRDSSAREVFNHKTVRLQTLNLANNKISILDNDIFSNVTSLTNLDLSHNQLPSIAGMWLQNSDTIKTLNVSFNRITTVDPKLFKTLSALVVLDLSGNPFTCNCDLAEFRSWVDTSAVELRNFNVEGYYLCGGPYSWKGIDLLHFQVHDNCRDPVDKRIILVVIGCTAFAIFLIAGIIFYQHRWRIKRKLARSQDYRAIYDNNGTGIGSATGTGATGMSATMSLPPQAPTRQYGGRDQRDWV